MVETRKRRIVRRAVIGLTIPAVLMCLYVSAFWAAAWIEDSCYGGQPVIRHAAFFGPLREYGASNAPGSLEFTAASMYFANGGRVPFKKVYEVATELRQAGRL